MCEALADAPANTYVVYLHINYMFLKNMEQRSVWEGKVKVIFILKHASISFLISLDIPQMRVFGTEVLEQDFSCLNH